MATYKYVSKEMMSNYFKTFIVIFVIFFSVIIWLIIENKPHHVNVQNHIESVQTVHLGNIGKQEIPPIPQTVRDQADYVVTFTIRKKYICQGLANAIAYASSFPDVRVNVWIGRKDYTHWDGRSLLLGKLIMCIMKRPNIRLLFLDEYFLTDDDYLLNGKGFHFLVMSMSSARYVLFVRDTCLPLLRPQAYHLAPLTVIPSTEPRNWSERRATFQQQCKDIGIHIASHSSFFDEKFCEDILFVDRFSAWKMTQILAGLTLHFRYMTSLRHFEAATLKLAVAISNMDCRDISHNSWKPCAIVSDENVFEGGYNNGEVTHINFSKSYSNTLRHPIFGQYMTTSIKSFAPMVNYKHWLRCIVSSSCLTIFADQAHEFKIKNPKIIADVIRELNTACRIAKE